MPVLWHQTLLSFVSIYRNELDVSQCAKLSSLVAQGAGRTCHPLVSTEIRRLLEHRRVQIEGARADAAEGGSAATSLPSVVEEQMETTGGQVDEQVNMDAEIDGNLDFQ